MKFYGEVERGPGKNWLGLDFGGDPVHNPDPGSWIRITDFLFTIK